MTDKFTPEIMRARFWELTDKKDVLNAELTPLRERRDALRDALKKPEEVYREAKRAVVAVERPRMSEIDAEMAIIARALGQKVGPRPS